MTDVRIAIAGVGNCASSLVQGIAYYRDNNTVGLAHPDIGGYRASDLVPVVAFDIDRRKVGRPLHEAVFAKPNCTTIFKPTLPDFGVTVKMGPVLDGVAEHMASYPDEKAFQPMDQEPANIVRELKESGAHVLICLLPVGAERAARAYADACLDAGVALVNCIPVFLASDKEYAARFKARGLPMVGDDIKSQFGATLLHRMLTRTLCDRGAKPARTYQLNVGGNTDFLNMLERARLGSKKQSKTEAVQSQADGLLHPSNIHIGPSDFVPWLEDNKLAFLRMEWLGFGGVPMNVEIRLSVEDSPNSAGVVIDAVRYAKLGMDRGIGGPLNAVSAYLMKRPPEQMRDDEARALIEDFLSSSS